MRKTIKILAIITALCALLALSAFAADFGHCADALCELGLFKGTNNGYELEREAQRCEAATMLVRLLGAEEEALALAYTAPYTDVADWAKPYVQYLHDKGLTKGTSETTFGYADKCDAQQYATFLLRALGYSDGEGGDFTYDTALEFGEKLGVCDWANSGGEVFLRDNIAAMSYTALALPTKTGEADLLAKLVSSGAVTDAKGYDVFFANYRDYAGATEKLNTAEKLSADIVITKSAATDASQSIERFDMKLAIELVAEDPSKSKMSYVGKVSGDGVSGETEIYFTDGYMYVSSGEEKAKTEASYFDTITKTGAAVSTDPICILRAMDKTAGSSGTAVYNATLRSELLNKISVLSSELEYTSDMSVSVTLSGEDVVSIGGTVKASGAEEIDISYEYKNIKTGDDVTVTLPTDLGTYK